MSNEETQDTSMDALADAMREAQTYTTEAGFELELHKATVQDHPIVLKVVKSISKQMLELQTPEEGDSPRSQAQQVDFAFEIIESNFPLVLEVVERLTSLNNDQVQALTLSDLLSICTRLWMLNQRFFTQAMALLPMSLGQFTPQESTNGNENRAQRRRRQKQKS